MPDTTGEATLMMKYGQMHGALFWALTLVISPSLAESTTTVDPVHTNNDYVIVLAKASTIRTVVEKALSSTQYVENIARYNGIDDLAAVIPEGSIVKIPKPYREVEQSGVISYAKGDAVLITAKTVVNPVTKSTRISKGDQLKTGVDGFLSLSFRSGTVLNIQAESHVIVKNIDCIDNSAECVIALRAEQGVVNSRVAPRSSDLPQVRYTVDTPFLTAAVRGTEFYVDVRSNAGRLGVTEGRVAAIADLATASLPRGQGWLAVGNQSPEQVDLLPAPQIRAGKWFSTEDKLLWQSVDGAVAYQLIMSADALQDQPISQERVLQSGIDVPALTPGEYFISLAGIDNDDFVGLRSQSMSLSYAEIDNDELPLKLDVRRQDTIDIEVQDYEGQIEVVFGDSTDRITERVLHNTADGILQLEMDSDQPIVIRARKVLGEYLVSRYSNDYVFEP